MRTWLAYSFFFVILGLFSCQKELSFEAGLPSRGSLSSDLSGECNPITVFGVYVADKNLTANDYIEVEVNVTQAGSYNIKTDIQNGYSFQSAGNFENAGIQTLQLKGTGKPLATGENIFTIVYDSTICTVAITVLPAGSSGTAAFALQGAGSACMNAVVQGTYAPGVALTAANKLDVQLNVSSPGTYIISTNTANGFSFSGTGTLVATGIQTITLNGSGTPGTADSTTFTVTAGGSSCTIKIGVSGTTPPSTSNNDHFPLTPNSWWSYFEVASPSDTTKLTNVGSATISGNTYRIFQYRYNADPYDSSYYRKTGNDYFEYTFADNFSLVEFDNDVVGDILFLKEGLATGTTWNSAEFTGTIGGIAAKLRYQFTTVDANATVTLGGKSFTEVYKINFKPQISLGGTAYVDDAITWQAFYAKGVGLIYLKGTAGAGVYEIQIKNYQVF
jgi:hypothetical protein